MARIITKFKYLKPDERNHFGGYAEYIATREGVEKIDESKRNAPATNKQKQLIKKIPVSYTHLDVYKRQGQELSSETHPHQHP